MTCSTSTPRVARKSLFSDEHVVELRDAVVGRKKAALTNIGLAVVYTVAEGRGGFIHTGREPVPAA